MINIWNNLTDILDYNGIADYAKTESRITFFTDKFVITYKRSDRILQQIKEITGNLNLNCLREVK